MGYVGIDRPAPNKNPPLQMERGFFFNGLGMPLWGSLRSDDDESVALGRAHQEHNAFGKRLFFHHGIEFLDGLDGPLTDSGNDHCHGPDRPLQRGFRRERR